MPSPLSSPDSASVSAGEPVTLSAALEQLAEQRAQVASLTASLRSSRQQHVHGMAALEAEEEAISNRLTHRLAKARETVAALARDSESETEVRAGALRRRGGFEHSPEVAKVPSPNIADSTCAWCSIQPPSF